MGAPESGGPAPEGSREPNSQLFPDALRKLATFGSQLADVLVRHRKVEALTGEKNVIGRQNLVEALAHLGVLFARAPQLNRDEQLEQIAYLRDHLRRVMMESFEVEVYVTIAALWDKESSNSVGRLYDSMAAPLIRRRQLLGHISPEEVETRFDQITDDIVQARRLKVADEDWDAWTNAADDFESAAKKMKSLRREMGAAVDAAKAKRSQLRLMIAGAVGSAALGVGGTLLVQAIT
jgi:hypothetical protein